MSNRMMTAALALLCLAASGMMTEAAPMTAQAFMKAVNTNADKTISKAEVETYAKRRFAALEADNDKTLDQKELVGRLSAAGLRRADGDKDRTLDETEFVTYADKLFDLANKKGDKTLSVAELQAPAGGRLIMFLQ